jgi:hypothetical protein
MAQGGDFVGGGKAKKSIKPIRKVMNSFFCMTDRPFRFMSKLNDDTTTYVMQGNRGLVLLTSISISLGQEDTQQNDGGLTELYKKFGTYVKSFYSVMYAPSCVKIRPMGDHRIRLHHSIDWGATVPKIIREECRKPR